jgi:hypothetical protein
LSLKQRRSTGDEHQSHGDWQNDDPHDTDLLEGFGLAVYRPELDTQRRFEYNTRPCGMFCACPSLPCS